MQGATQALAWLHPMQDGQLHLEDGCIAVGELVRDDAETQVGQHLPEAIAAWEANVQACNIAHMDTSSAGSDGWMPVSAEAWTAAAAVPSVHSSFFSSCAQKPARHTSYLPVHSRQSLSCGSISEGPVPGLGQLPAAGMRSCGLLMRNVQTRPVGCQDAEVSYSAVWMAEGPVAAGASSAPNQSNHVTCTLLPYLL